MGFSIAMTEPTKFLSSRVQDAIAWQTRLTSGDEAESDWIEFTEWLEAGPENRLAYEQVEQFSGSLDGLPLASADREQSSTPNFRAAFARKIVQSPIPWVGAALAAAAVLLIVSGIPSGPPQVIAATYSTHVGETHSVRLADGSVLDLNTNTLIRTFLGNGQRRVSLIRGEVLFHVSKDSAHPFEVLIGSHKVQVIGTVFDVLRTDHKVSVTVAEGRVRFGNAGSGSAVTLTPSDQLVYRETIGVRVSRVPSNAASAWRNGYVVYENGTLADVVDDLNRYFKHKVHVDTHTGQERFSGVLQMDREEDVLGRLTHLLPVKVEREGNAAVILRGSASKR